ncbi:hypothetical protein BN131_2618 [Cronobacter malonaticus 681]|nr:hypothetical protein BN131_2618 [Cronobacter malonaticus 681]
MARRETRVAADRGAAFRLVGVNAPALQHVVLVVQHLITAHAPVRCIGGGLPLIMHAQVGGVAVPAHHVAGAIPAEAARDDAVRVGHVSQLPVFVIAVSDQQATLAVAYLMHAGETAMRFLIREFDIQRFVVAGNPHQPAVFIPAVILAVLVTIVDAEQPPLARTRRVRFVDVVFAARHLEHQRAADGVIERDAVFEIIHHVAGGQLAEAQLAARHIAPDKLIVLKAEEAGFKRQQPAGAEHTGRQIAAVVDTLPDERNAVFQREIAVFAAREDFRAAGDIHRVLRLARLTANASRLKQGNRRQPHGEIRKKLAAEHLAHATVEYRPEQPFAEIAQYSRPKATDSVTDKPRPEILTAADIAYHDALAADVHPRVFQDLDFGFAGAAVAVATRWLPVDQHFFRAFRQKVGAGGHMAFSAIDGIARRSFGVRAGTLDHRLGEVIPDAGREVFDGASAVFSDGFRSRPYLIHGGHSNLRQLKNIDSHAHRHLFSGVEKALLRNGVVEIVMIDGTRPDPTRFAHNENVGRTAADSGIGRAAPAKEVADGVNALTDKITDLFRPVGRIGDTNNRHAYHSGKRV